MSTSAQRVAEAQPQLGHVVEVHPVDARRRAVPTAAIATQAEILPHVLVLLHLDPGQVRVERGRQQRVQASTASATRVTWSPMSRKNGAESSWRKGYEVAANRCIGTRSG